LISCKKEEPEPSNPAPKANYVSLKIGNYWVYDRYRVDSLGNEELLNSTDSIIVKCDTVIHNKKYYVLENFFGNSPQHLTFLRDSSGYIVNERGTILFSATNFTDVLSFREEYRPDNGILLYTLSDKMEKVGNPVTVPAGRFNDVLNFKGTVIIPQNDDNSITKEMNTLYAKNIGKIWYEERWLNVEHWVGIQLDRVLKVIFLY
jgi:hypothetical protein